MTYPIVLIIVGVLVGWLSGKLLSGPLARIVSIIGWVMTVVGIILLILALI